MPRYLYPLLKTLSHLACLLLLYTCFRLLFLAFNQDLFPALTFPSLLKLLISGLRFDMSAIISVNCLYIFLALFPWRTISGKGKKLLRLLFISTNIVALLFEAADWVYFPFNHKRSTAEVLNMVGRKGDFLDLFPGFLVTYWYIFLLAAALGIVIALSYTFIGRRFDYTGTETTGKKYYLQKVIIFFSGILLAFIGQRGGLQLVPVNLRNAVATTRSEYVPIVLNTPFSIINSVTSHRLVSLAFMPQSEAEHIVRPLKQYSSNASRRKNVVFIILESFSKEFTRLGGSTSYTPFLDSLMDQGLTFTNAYANGLHSSEGIPAILAGIPSLMEEPFTTSIYGTNKITSVATLLKPEGYSTSFYHGAANGSMSFDVFTKSAGIDNYFGRSEYGSKDYDGSWGIFDEPFLQYFADGLSRQQEPFLSAVFTITSHPPYPIPAQYKDHFPKGKLQILECIGYTDHAVRKFFEKAKQQSWYENTLFVITADHCSPVASNDYYAFGPGRYQIPVIFFAPGDAQLKGNNNALFQQIDILPSVMQYLGYGKPFFALGNSCFDSIANRYVINDLSSVYEWISEGYYLKISNNAVTAAFRFPADSTRQYNLAGTAQHTPPISKAYQHWQALLQVYTEAMIHNHMDASKYQQAD